MSSTNKSNPSFWYGDVPETDDFGRMIDDVFIDGATTRGPWAIMSPLSFAIHGVGLGQGMGQKYQYDPKNGWLKVEG